LKSIREGKEARGNVAAETVSLRSIGERGRETIKRKKALTGLVRNAENARVRVAIKGTKTVMRHRGGWKKGSMDIPPEDDATNKKEGDRRKQHGMKNKETAGHFGLRKKQLLNVREPKNRHVCIARKSDAGL